MPAFLFVAEQKGGPLPFEDNAGVTCFDCRETNSFNGWAKAQKRILEPEDDIPISTCRKQIANVDNSIRSFISVLEGLGLAFDIELIEVSAEVFHIADLAIAGVYCVAVAQNESHSPKDEKTSTLFTLK